MNRHRNTREVGRVLTQPTTPEKWHRNGAPRRPTGTGAIFTIAIVSSESSRTALLGRELRPKSRVLAVVSPPLRHGSFPRSTGQECRRKKRGKSPWCTQRLYAVGDIRPFTNPLK
ncbi:hypothetical protein MTO96_004370 [Rhipicephalus appendiculatus]